MMYKNSKRLYHMNIKKVSICTRKRYIYRLCSLLTKKQFDIGNNGVLKTVVQVISCPQSSNG